MVKWTDFTNKCVLKSEQYLVNNQTLLKFVKEKNLNKMESLITKNKFYCPLCKNNLIISDYLQEVFGNDEKALWLTNMVTHYRHTHITSWNKCWGYNGGQYRQNWFRNYEEEKKKVNERAKRQIIRKASDYILYHSIDLNTFNKLQNNDTKTIMLLNKVCNKTETISFKQ
jgi:hypothetical protein